MPVRLPATVPAQNLFAPAQAGRVERRSILQRVFGERAPGVVILQAPAGHGKSVALGQTKLACEGRGLACAWLNLDESDNDSRRHASHLRALLTQLPGAPAPPERLVESAEHARRLAQRADWLIDALGQLNREIALFLDEFEVITDRSILSFWRDFLARRPPSVRVFIATRSAPDLGLARLLVGDRVMLLSADDLRFSRQEVHAFFELDENSTLRPAEIETIYRRSEGWPAALQLFRLGLSNPETRRMLGSLEHSRPRELAEYLTESVLAGQPEQVREFLLRTSILTRLTGPLCDHVTGHQDGQQMLARLEREGLFVRALDTERRWFRYHALFSSLLVDQLSEAQPAAVVDLHRRAAQWLRDGGHFEDAMRHAVASKEYGLACDILRHWSSRLVANGEMATVGHWLDQIPKEHLDRDETLSIRLVWALTFLHRPATLASHLCALERLRATRGEGVVDDSTTVRAISVMCSDRVQEARELIGRSPIADIDVEGFEAFEQAAGENLRAYLAIFHGDLAAARRHLTRARSFNHLGAATFTAGYTACFEGALLVLEGRVRHAIECLREGIQQQRSVLDSSFVSAVLASCYIWALYEADDLEMLEAVAEEYRDILPDTPVPDFFTVGQICIARVHLRRGREEDAILILEQAQYVATCNGWDRMLPMLEWEKRAAPFRYFKGAFENQRRPTPTTKPDSSGDGSACTAPQWHSPAAEMVTSTRFLLASNACESNLDRREAANLGSGSVYRGLQERIERGLLERASGRTTAALRSIRQALAIASKTGLVAPLLDHGPAVASLIRDLLDADSLAARSEDRALAKRLLSELQGNAPSVGPALTAPTILSYATFTEREREMLGLLSRRLSNKEIARRTLLSANTVKFHLKNIFTKLGVSSRLEAFAAIVRLDLSAPPKE